MDSYIIITALVFLSAVFGYINVRIFKLPNTIGLMFITMLYTLGVLALSYFDDTLLNMEIKLIHQIDFKEVLLDNMLSFLLFAGALHTNYQDLKILRWPVIAFATIGVFISTFLVGGAMYWLLDLLGMQVNFIYCLLFGALISPTDPIAVLGILKKAGVPKKLETKIVGESLFNDGIGVVMFLVIFKIASSSGQGIAASDVMKLLGFEVIGGVVLGLFLGWIIYLLLKSINDFNIEVIITLAAVMVGTLIAEKMHFSGPLAMVTAGLMVGNDKPRLKKGSKKEISAAMSDVTRQYVDKFWELIDILLNAVLFVLIGMEMLVLVFKGAYIYAGLLAIPIILVCRYMSLLLPITFFKKRLKFVPKTNLIMTWGGLRGGISIALALGLSQEMHRDLFLVITYIVVVFSILFQGLTIEKLVKKLSI